MYFPDLHVEDMHYGVKAIKVGWLDKGKPYTQWKKSDEEMLAELIIKLEEIGPGIFTKGFHVCPFCAGEESSRQYIIKFKDGKTFYDAPEMITHYIIEHNYLPPQEFIDAVMKYKNHDTRICTQFFR